MAETVTRGVRPVNFRQESTISPDNLERNFRHADDEIDKIYQILGEEGIINQATIRTVVVGSGGTGGTGGTGGGVTTFILLTDTPSFFSGAGGQLVKVNAGATALEFADEIGSEYWQDPVNDKDLTTPPI